MSGETDDRDVVYSVRERDGRFEVCAASGRVIMVCHEDRSAAHYVSLLNEAFRAGYKKGYRAGREN